MTINTIKNILNVVTDETAVAELTAELARLEKAQAARAIKSAEKAAMYTAARDIVIANTEPVTEYTAADIWECCAGKFDEGFTKANLSYALSRVWTDLFTKDSTGKVNTYTRA